GVRAHQAEGGRDGAAHAEHAGAAVLRVEPVAIEAVVHRGRTEVPDDRRAVLGQEREAAELVALPLADLGAGAVADVVAVEPAERAALAVPQRLPRPGQAIALQPAQIDLGLEVVANAPGRRQLALPVPARIEIVGAARALVRGFWCH